MNPAVHGSSLTVGKRSKRSKKGEKGDADDHSLNTTNSEETKEMDDVESVKPATEKVFCYFIKKIVKGILQIELQS